MAKKSSIEFLEDPVNLRIAMLGNVDAGKSTLTGLLTSAPGTKDDGRGALRTAVANFQHEVNSGRTSSVAHHIVGFKENGEQYVSKMKVGSKQSKVWPDIVKNSTRTIRLMDMPGHEKYLKTTMDGLTSMFPDYGMLVIAANKQISDMTKEHILICLQLKIPFFIVLTKMDITPQNIYDMKMDRLQKMMKHKELNKEPMLVKD